MASLPVITIIINLLANILPLIGVHVASADLEQATQTVIALVSGIYLWISHVQQKKEIVGASKVNVFGGIKS